MRYYQHGAEDSAGLVEDHTYHASVPALETVPLLYRIAQNCNSRTKEVPKAFGGPSVQPMITLI